MATTLALIGAGIMVLVGLIGFFKPMLILGNMKVEINSPMGWSEIRAVLGGMNLGLGIAAFTLGSPAVFTAIGIAWAVLILARLWSMVADSTSLKETIPGLIVDGTLSFLFLSPLVLG